MLKFKLLPIAAAVVFSSCGGSNEESTVAEDINENIEAIDESSLDQNNPASNPTVMPTEGVTGLDSISKDNKEAMSIIFGSYLATSFKKQGLDFIEPIKFIESYKKCRATQSTDFTSSELNQKFQALVDSSQQFKAITEPQKEEAMLLFPQLFYSDFCKSELYKELVHNKFDEGFLKSWETGATPNQKEVQAFTVFNTEITQRENAKKSAKAKAEGEAFLAANGKKPGVKTTASGLQYEVLREGTGEKPTAESTVTAHYEGTLTNGDVFDSSYERGNPIDFPLNGVIKGWTEGLQLMKVGAKYKFYIPYDLGYGERGSGRKIPPFSTLIFTVELVAIK